MPVWFWIVIGAVVLGALFGGKNSGKKTASGQPFRIDHPHYIDDDDCECSRCGARFKEKVMECPRCGARFGMAGRMIWNLSKRWKFLTGMTTEPVRGSDCCGEDCA